MGNRILKESITTSAKLAKLTDFEFRLWVGLLTLADDYGCADGRIVVIRNLVFATNPNVTVQQVAKAMKKLEKVGCIRTYEAEGQPYFWFPTWLEHQRLRHHTPKLPQPPELEAVIAARREESARTAEKRKKDGRQKPYDYQPVYEGFEEPEAASEEAPLSEEEPSTAAEEPALPEEEPVPPERDDGAYSGMTAQECRERIEGYRAFGMEPPGELVRRARSLGMYLGNTG